MPALTIRLSFTDRDINIFQRYYITIYNYDHASDIPHLTQLSATIIDNDIHNIQIGTKVSADFKDAISFQTALAGTCSLVFDIDADHVVKNIKLLWN